ncbi:hypothetical protein LZ554_004693 [Drepanopeziza brunnea f. sp. 'monogermtubi']|nr:hypothetical protein LZ554_004693 [Drepanopeziza brunnea f. sp. 'monogermtubi']
MQRTPPLALTPALPSELLSYILTHNSQPTTLIICQPRASFLLSLQRCMPNTVQRQPPPPPHQQQAQQQQRSSSIPPDTEPPNAERDGTVGERDVDRDGGEKQRHPLLVATLHQIATSRSINLVFVATVSHLRAYLSVFPPPALEAEAEPLRRPRFERQGNGAPFLVVYGLVSLHRDTSEWSAQGLGNSVAGLVEAGKRAGRRIVVVEERQGDEDEVGNGEERMPMLNGSLRRAGLESEDGGWSGRTVEVGRVLGRWFRFKKGEWDV